jgi:prevent-host-death family protein
MPTIGICELKRQNSRVLRQVREQGEEYKVTYHGQVVARVVPVSQDQPDAHDLEVWSDLDRVAAEIGAHWPSWVSATDAVREGRRKL